MPGVTVAGIAWAAASLFAPAPAPRAEAANPMQHATALSMTHTAVATGTSRRLLRPNVDFAMAARFSEPAARKSARSLSVPELAAPVEPGEDPFDRIVKKAALTPDRMRVAFQTAYLAGVMQVARDAPARTEPSVASAAPEGRPPAPADVAALTPEIVPLPQSRPSFAGPAKPENPVVAVAAVKPERPIVEKPEKPAGLLAGFLSAKPQQPAQPEKPVKTEKPARAEKPAPVLAFARPDTPDRGMAGAFNGLFNKPRAGNGVAIYDISAGVVIMPDGERLEAHSGIGEMADNPRYVHVKMNGPTPPNTYKLSMREKRFHGVEAIRMTPIGDEPMHGRAGILAHSYLLRGRTGQSHGCVAFKDYQRFLKAYKEGKVTHIVVVPGNGRKSPSREKTASKEV